MEKNIKLNNGVLMPRLGYGAASIHGWQNDGEEVSKVIADAIKSGFRAIDTAMIYNTEKNVGEAIKLSGIKRDELFITTKVWNSDNGYDETLKAFDLSQKKLDLDQIDMYLIHWRIPEKVFDTYRALERLYEEKRVKAIGVCNFTPAHLKELFAKTNIKPATNQVELHPYFIQEETRNFNKENEIVTISWSPLGSGDWNTSAANKKKPITDETIKKIGEKYNKTIGQIIIRWHLQHGLAVIPKTQKIERMKENLNVFDFELNAEEMKTIDALDTGKRLGDDPDKVDF